MYPPQRATFPCLMKKVCAPLHDRKHHCAEMQAVACMQLVALHIVFDVCPAKHQTLPVCMVQADKPHHIPSCLEDRLLSLQ